MGKNVAKGRSLFRGVHTLSLDAKGRVAVPSRYRERLQDRCAGRMVVTVNPDEPCLWLYPMPEWEQVETALNRLPRIDRYGTQLKRRLMRYASDCALDTAGRVLLPPVLREFSELNKSLVLFGMSNKFEIWSEENWLANEAAMASEKIDPAEASEASRNLVL